MTEQREPPLLNEEEIKESVQKLHNDLFPYISDTLQEWESVAQAERDICIKWMKENCYLKAKRELPECPFLFVVNGERFKFKGCKTWEEAEWAKDGYKTAQDNMLKEVDGVAYRACEEFKDVK